MKDEEFYLHRSQRLEKFLNAKNIDMIRESDFIRNQIDDAQRYHRQDDIEFATELVIRKYKEMKKELGLI